MKKFILVIFTILGMVVSSAFAQNLIPNSSPQVFPDGFVSGNVVSMANGIAAGEFEVINSDIQNIYDIENNRQVGTNADLYMPIEDVLTLADGGYYTRAIRLSEGDTVLIYTSSHDDEWRVLDTHDNVPAGWAYENVKLQSIFYMNNLPAYMYSVYEGSIGANPDSRRVELYLYNFENESFELAYQHFFESSFDMRGITNISHTDIFWHEGFGSNSLGIWAFDDSSKSVERTMYDTEELIGARIQNSYHMSYNQNDNEMLLALNIDETGVSGYEQGIYRLKLNETISGQRLEKMFTNQSSMSLHSDVFHYINESRIGSGYLWYNRRNGGQNITYINGDVVNYDRGLHLIPANFSQISTVQTGSHLSDYFGITTDLYASNDKIYLSTNPDITEEASFYAPLELQIDGEWISSDGVSILDFNDIEEPIITESVSIINEIESLRVGSNYSFSASQMPNEVDSPGITWSLEVIEGENPAELVDSQLFGLNPGVVKVTATANDNPSAFAEIIVTIYKEIEDTTGVNDSTDVTSISFEQEEISLKLYPNPTTARIALQNFPEVERLLYNMTGQLVGRFHAMEQSIDLSNYPTGMYFLKVGTITEKVIKK